MHLGFRNRLSSRDREDGGGSNESREVGGREEEGKTWGE